MQLKRKYTVNGDKDFWSLIPDSVRETAVLHLLAKEYPQYFEFITEFTLGGLKEDVYLKINTFDLHKLIPPGVTITVKDDLPMSAYFEADPDSVKTILECSVCGSTELTFLYTETAYGLEETCFIDYYSCGKCSAEQQVRRDAEK